MAEKFEGGCLCGAVRYQHGGEAMVVADCFCEDCRRSSGTSHCTHMALPTDGFKVTGETSAYARPADSGNVVTRHFCGTCGSAVYSTNSAMEGMTFVRVSSLDDLNAVEPQMTVYASRAPKWARIDDSKPVFQVIMEGGAETVLKRD